MRIQCAVAQEVNRVVFGEYELREPHGDEILVRTAYSTISPGTELRCLNGKEPNAGNFPMITGYSLAGTVVHAAGDLKEGETVFLGGTMVCPEGIRRSWGGHVSHAIAPAAEAVRIPRGVDLKAASAVAMLTIALHGVCRTRPLPGERVLVVGQGLIGLCAAVLLRIAGCCVAVCDPLPHRRETAGRMGIPLAVPPDEDGQRRLREQFPAGVDILVDATGSPAVVKSNLPWLREKSWTNPYESSPKLVLLASYPGDICLDYQETLLNKETDVITCRNYLPHEREQVVRLLTAGTLNMDPVLDLVVPAEKAAEAFDMLRNEPDKHLTVVLDWTNGRYLTA